MLTGGSVFSGIGLLDYGLHCAGVEHRWFCEVKPFRRAVLARRWPGARVFDDIRAVDHGAAEPVDLIAGGFPCKGASSAGLQNGFDHPETALWHEMARIVGELRPRYVLVENVANILALRDGAIWARVLGDLAALGYDVEWDCVPAAAVGAPHRRDRVLAVAAHADLGAVGPGRLWRGEREADQGSAPDADSRPAGTGEPSWDAGPGWPSALRGDQDDAPDADGARQRRQGPPAGSGVGRPRRRDELGAATEAAADADRRRRAEQPQRDSERWEREYGPRWADAQRRRGVGVEWGEHEPAIRRWERALGRAAPEPLVRGVDDGRTSWVERSRLSALGDGVQVQVGLLAGAYIVELERQRLVSEAVA